MHLSKLDGAHRDDPRFFPDRGPKEMDYRQKMVVAPHQKYKREEEDDDEDLEALRLAALQSLRAKDTMQSKRQTVSTLQATQHQQQQQQQQLHHQQQQHQHHALYKGPRLVPRRGFYGNRQQRQNGNLYYHSPRNPNLIAIVPVEEEATVQPVVPPVSNRAEGERIERSAGEDSKFCRYKDNASGSEDDESRTPRFKSNLPPLNRVIKEEPVADRTKPDDSVRTKEDPPESHRPEKESSESKENFTNKEHRSAPEESPRQPEDASGAEEEEEGEEEEEEEEEASEEDEEEEEEEERQNDDDDDVLLMADLEEEDSLERLMDEMEREMNVDKPTSEKRERRAAERSATRTSKKVAGEEKCPAKSRKSKARAAESTRSDSPSIRSSPASSGQCGEKRSASPHGGAARPAHKRRSLSPKLRSRKKSPRRSPPSRRSPSRPTKKTVRELPPRFRSPRKSPPRFSPRPRSPRLSPLRRSPVRRGGSPRGRSPRRSHSRSPLSRSSLRSRSPARRSRSPARISPRSRSPKLSPRSSPPRRGSSLRPRSPKLSPRRSPPSRLRSPRLSPHRSPWSSPRRRRSPPKESSRRSRPRSVTPEAPASPYLKKETSPLFRSRASPVETTRSKAKQREEAAAAEKAQVSMDTAKNSRDGFSDPVLEARRKKFECTKPIDPLQANKKIKLSKESDKKRTVAEDIPNTSVNVRKVNVIEEEEPDSTEADLCLDTDDYAFEDLEDEAREASKISGGSSDAEQQPVRVEKERPSKRKKKKRDKELYQVGKLKGELPLSERIGKEKKKKRKDVVPDDGPSEQPETPVFEDLAIDEEGDLRTELSRRRAERLNRTVPVQSARLLQSAFKGVVNEVAKSNAKVNRRHVVKGDEKSSQKEVRRVTVLHRTTADLHDSEDETNATATLDSKVPVRFRLGINKAQDTRLDPAPAKASRKTSKRQGRKVKHKNNLTLTDPEHAL